MGVAESTELVYEPLAAELGRSPASLFGVIMQDPYHGPRLRYCWLGVRHVVTGAVCGAVLAMREYGLDARTEHATDIFQFGPMSGPDRFDEKLVAHWVIGNQIRGIPLINEADDEGRPIITDTRENQVPYF